VADSSARPGADADGEVTLAGTLSPTPGMASSSQMLIELGTTRVGRYLVLDELGRGGMGVVYAAFDPELDRKVAVKVLKRWDDAVEGSQGHKRLLREAQAMARLKHPNVVTVHDAGMHEGRVFVAFELIEGSTLTAWLKAEQRSVTEIVAVFVQAGRGLAAAHAKGLVHRDFKPDNVMIDRGPVARVMDFGLARVAGAAKERGEGQPPSSDALGDDLTHHGRVVGTPRYMAPEQHLGHEIDARSDQFAFCVALWEALDGAHPFGGETMTELAARVVAGARQAPSAHSRMPARVRRALDRGLATAPDERCPSLDALLEVLEQDPSRLRRRVSIAAGVVVLLAGAFGTTRLLQARAVEDCRQRGTTIRDVWDDAIRERLGKQMLASGIAHAQPTFERLVPWLDTWATRWRGFAEEACLAAEVEVRWSASTASKADACLDGRREMFAGLIDGLHEPDAITLAQAIGAAAELPRPEDCVDERHLVLLPNVDGGTDEKARELRARLARAWGETKLGRLEETAAEAEAIHADAVDADLARSAIEATLLAGAVATAKAAYDPALEHYRGAFAAALEHDAPDLALDAVLGIMGTAGVQLARTENGLAWEPVARALLRRLGEERSGREARLLTVLGAIHQKSSDYARARELLTASLEIRREQVGSDHPALEGGLDGLAHVEYDLGNYDGAAELAVRLVELEEKIYGPDHPALANGLELMGIVDEAQGDHAAAEALNRRALSIREAAYGPDHPVVAMALSNVGLSMYRRGDNDNARAMFERALAIQNGHLDADHPAVVSTLVNLGNVQLALGDDALAKATFTRALELGRRKLGPDHSTVGIVLANLANTAAAMGAVDEAIVHQREALAILERRMGSQHPSVATPMMNLAQLHIRRGEADLALARLQRALEILHASVGDEHPDVAYALLGVAEAELDRGHRQEAQAAAERALAIREAHEVSPEELASARLLLAQTLEDHARARTLAEQARAGFEGVKPEMVETVDAFLREL
jgi:tetratricopeptide (TPR) repeat protein